jgi:poly-gamma-glutamate synthase PgsB/CapB
VDELGKHRDGIARSFASSIPEKSTVFIPEEEFHPEFKVSAERAGANLLLVPPGLSETIPACGFEQNFRLALAVVEFLGKDRDKAYRAALRAAPDFGGLKVWKGKKDSSLNGWFFVSAFASNDPETTKDVLVKLAKRGLFTGKKRIGLLNLRKDRGSRTMQWWDALQDEKAFEFDRLVFVGEHALALRDKLKRRLKPEISVFREKKPEDLITQIATLEKDEAVVFGMGNMGGIGRLLVDYWEMTENRHDV